MRRAILGIIAGLLVACGGAMYFGLLRDMEQTGGILLKAGLGLSTIWLAMPQLDDVFSSPKGLLKIVLILCIGICLFFPRLLFVLFPIILVVVILQFFSWLFTPE